MAHGANLVVEECRNKRRTDSKTCYLERGQLGPHSVHGIEVDVTFCENILSYVFPAIDRHLATVTAA